MDISANSKALLALALLLLECKPPDVSVREYVNTLRSSTRPGKRLSEPLRNEEDEGKTSFRHVCGADYWMQRFNEREVKLMELQVQIRELNEEKRLLSLQADAAVGAANIENKKRHKKQLDPQAIIDQDEFARKWEACKAVYEPISPASSPLLGQLRILHLANGHEAVSQAFKNVCETLLLTIEELCTNPHAPLLCSPDKGQQSASASKLPLTKADFRNESICKAIDLVFRRLLMSLSDFNSSTARAEHRLAIRDAFVRLLVGTVDAIHLNSKLLLSISNSSADVVEAQEKLTKRDLRAGLTATLVSFVSSLQYTFESNLEREILEAAAYVVLEAAGRCLCQQQARKSAEPLSKPAALKATSVFILDWLRCILAKYKSYVNCSASGDGGGLGHGALVRFHEAIMFGVFAGKHEVEVGKQGGDDDLDDTTIATDHDEENRNSILKMAVGKGKKWGGMKAGEDFILVDDAFADEVWKLVGLEAFMMTL